MKIPAPNYTMAPNIIYDEIMCHLNEGEIKILMIIMRQTFGWHKLEDWITITFLSKKTGYERRSISRILQRLIEKNLVCKRIEGPIGSQRCYYSLILEHVEREPLNDDDGVESEEEMACFQKIPTPDPGVTPPCFQKIPTPDPGVRGPLTDGSPTKETLTKEKQQQQDKATSKEKTAVAVFFTSPKEEQPKSTQLTGNSGQMKTPIFSILETVDIPEADKLEITQRNDEQTVINAVGWLNAQSEISNCPAAALKFACNKKLSPPVKKEDAFGKNKQYAMRYDGFFNQLAQIECYYAYVEIRNDGVYGAISIAYDEKGFIEQFHNALRKNNFKILNE